MATLCMQVTTAVRVGVLDGTYPGGVRLNEAELAAALGVSRTPVRGALSTLATEGLLDYTPNSGYVVRRFTPSDIGDIYVVRTRLDGFAARLAAECGLTDTQHGTILRILDDSRSVIEGGVVDDDVIAAWDSLNRRYHDVIYEACANPFLVDLLRRATEMPIVRYLRYADYSISSMTRAHEDHVEIAGAVIRREAERAEALGREHMHRAGRRVIDQLRRLEARSMAGGTASSVNGNPSSLGVEPTERRTGPAAC